MGIEVTIGSGNVFADLGLENAEERQAKAMLSIHIEQAINEHDWSTESAARVAGLSVDELERLLRGDLDDFSLGYLIDSLNRLDRDVEIRVSPAQGRGGRLTVAVGSIG